MGEEEGVRGKAEEWRVVSLEAEQKGREMIAFLRREEKINGCSTIERGWSVRGGEGRPPEWASASSISYGPLRPGCERRRAGVGR